MKNSTLSILVPAVAAAWMCNVHAQGPLQPDSAPGPSLRTLEQVEPRTPITNLPVTISQSGSYYLTGSLTAPPRTNGILITVSNVVIDLNGYGLYGAGWGRGIATASFGFRGSLAVYNGVISGWTNGIYAPDCEGSIFRDLRIENNLGSGAIIGPGSMVTRCLFAHNGVNTTSTALTVYYSSIVADCVAADNASYGLSVSGGLVADCVSRNNGAGISVSSYGLVTRCLASKNRGHGFSVNGLIMNNIAEGNRYLTTTSMGFRVLGQSRLDSNLARDNTGGINSAGGGNAFVRNVLLGNTDNITNSFAPSFLGSPDTTIAFTNSWANFSL